MTTDAIGNSRQEETTRQASILLLDDDESIAEYVASVFSDDEYRVTWVDSVARAVEAVNASVPDLALIDIRLPGESGLEFLEKLRADADLARVPVIMISGSSEPMDRELSLKMGADRYLVKPVRPENLRRVVHELLSARDDMWWTLSMKRPQVNRIRELLFDTTTEIPTLALVVDSLREVIEQGNELEVYCLELETLYRLGERDFWEEFDHLRREFVRGLHVVVSAVIGTDVMITTSHSGANDFYFFTRRQPERSPSHVAGEMETAARELLRGLEVDRSMLEEIAIFVGGTVTQTQPIYAPRILYNAVREAKDIAERRETRYFQVLSEKLRRAVRDQTIRTHFQPIVDLRTRQVVGHEALSRGPAGSEIESPEVIFELARDLQLVWELESLCIENVRPILTDICSRGLLFFNLESHFIQQLQLRGMDVLETFLACTGNVVIEVTERSAIRDYRTFRQTMHDLKKLGFKIAIDDCGSGYATLEAVAELQPDYLKVGHSLFQGVEKDPIRRQLVGLVARCADSIGATTVAEAIETEEQYNVCLDLGIKLGQGYFFSRPQSWEDLTR